MAVKELVFPSGVGRGLSFRQEVGRRERYTCPWAINVRTLDFQGRLRGGSWTPTAAATPSGVVHSGGHVTADPGNDAPGSSHDADCIYRDRFIRPVNQAIYASRQFDYTDWDMSSDISDTGRPWPVLQLSEAGEIGGNITALAPHKDAYLLAATSGSLWAVHGDLTVEGRLHNISRDVGMVGPKAWCRDHLDRYYFLSNHGLYTIGASGDGLQALSEDVVPEQLTGITDADTVLEYDHETRSVRIYIPTASVNWLFETERQGFWPFKVGASSHVAIGPVRLGDGQTYGRVIRMHGITATGSANVTWRVLVADTAEQVSASAKAAIETLVASGTPANIHSSGTWTAGVNHRSYPRARGLFMILLLSSSGTWGWEGCSIETAPSGKWR